MSTFDKILKEKLQKPVKAKGDGGKTMTPEEAMVNALLNNAMKGDIASISFIRNVTKVCDPEAETKALREHTENVKAIAVSLKEQLEEEGVWDGQATEVAMLAETAVFFDNLTRQMASPDFQEVVTDPRSGKQTVSPLIALRDSQRELFDKQLAKLRQDAINRRIIRDTTKR